MLRKVFLFYLWFYLYVYCLLNVPIPVFPFPSLSSLRRSPLADTVGHFTESVPSLQPLKKWPPAQCFDMQAADWRSSIQVLTQRQAAWLVWLPDAGHLPHTECCRLLRKAFEMHFYSNFNYLLIRCLFYNVYKVYLWVSANCWSIALISCGFTYSWLERR